MLTWGLVREAEFSSIAILALSPLRGEKRLKKCGISVTMSDFIYFFFKNLPCSYYKTTTALVQDSGQFFFSTKMFYTYQAYSRTVLFSAVATSPLVFNQGWFCPLESVFGNIQGEGARGQWLEARTVAKHRTVYNTVITAKNDQAPNVSSAKVEKPYTRHMGLLKNAN